mmetsp:Transcript_49692/g.89243  ORF Transcript_49692/g.89243 Transcript_49692/m.89243 type:complete len:2221 (+) Transcript_49692:337-6999(+)
MGRALLCCLHEPGPAKQEDAKAVMQLLALALRAVSKDRLPHRAVLSAVSYLLPLLVTFSYRSSELRENGPVSRMPQLSQVFVKSASIALAELSSPARSLANPLRTRPAFSRRASSKATERNQSHLLPLLSTCIFCDARAPGRPAKGSSWQSCNSCGMDLLSSDWAIFSQPRREKSLHLPSAWEEMRMPQDGQTKSCCLKNVKELLDLALALCSTVSGFSGPSRARGSATSALTLLEPNETQDTVDQRKTESPVEDAQNLRWLLACGAFGVCCAAPRQVLFSRSKDISGLLQALLKSGEDGRFWKASPIAILLQSSSFVSALVQDRDVLATPPEKKAKVMASESQQLQVACHNWKLQVLGMQQADPQETALRVAMLPPVLLRAAFAGPAEAMSSVLSYLVTRMSGMRHGFGKMAAFSASDCPSACLQRVFAFSMLAPICIDDLFGSFDRNLYLRLFERYSQREVRVASLCQLLLRGNLKSRVRLLLPKILPSMVLNQRMDTIQDICSLLNEEAVQSLFTPQLPYILSEMAQQPVQRIATAFVFILEQIYNKKLTMNSICDASLGKVLVLILWNSASLPQEEAYKRAVTAIENVAQALRVQHMRGPEPSRKRDAASGSSGPLPKKRKGGKGGSVIDVVDEVTAVPPEVVQTLEDSFLHILDILEIIFSGHQQSLKWAEYRPLLQDPLDLHLLRQSSTVDRSTDLDFGRLLKALALLLQMLAESLHRFAPKLLEFLQSATNFSSYHVQSLPCWQHFIKAVGVQRLKPLIPAVVSELLRLAGRIRHTPRAFQELTKKLLTDLVTDTCKLCPEIVASLPLLPNWEELRFASATMQQVSGGNQSSNSFSQRLNDRVAQLEGTTQQAVRRAVLESIEGLISAQREKGPATMTALPNQMLVRLMRALLKFLWESSAWPADQLLCGQLLGSIGAIDPCRFAGNDVCKSSNRSEDRRQGLGDMEVLAMRVLTDFLAPNLTSKNSYAFAAQEILKCLKTGGRAERVLAKLEREDVRETLRPYLNSSYQLVGPEPRATGHQGKASLESALAQAAALLKPDNRIFFEACLPAVPGNHALALFLMHHVLHEIITAASASAGGSNGKSLKDLSNTLAALLDADAEADSGSSSRQAATAQAVFAIVDDLSARREAIHGSTGTGRPGDETHKSRQLQCIEILKAPISNRKIVDAAVRCGAHARALQFLEEELIESAQSKGGNIFDMDGPRINDADCNLLQSIYRELGESDGVLGAIHIGPASARTRTPELELAGRWSDVQACYEEQLQRSPGRRDLLCGLVRCTQNMRRFENSLHLIRGIEGTEGKTGGDDPEGLSELRPAAVEAAWQLASWDRLSEALETPSTSKAQDTSDFQVQLGRALLAFHERKEEKLTSILRETTLQVTRAAASAARESYTRAYQHLLRLHVLSDIGWLWNRQADAGNSKASDPGSLAKNLLKRCEVTTASFSARQLLLSPLRVALQDLKLIDDAKHVELAFVRLCRKNGEPVAMEHPDVGFKGVGSSLMSSAQMEWGRLLYACGSRHDALRHMQQLAPKLPKARLLGTRWATEASSELLIPRVAEAEFKEARNGLQDSEAAWFYHAAYLDQLLKHQISEVASAPQNSANSAKQPRRPGTNPLGQNCPFDLKNLVIFTLRGYLQALQRGTKRLHFILNRVLQLAWECCEVDMHKKDLMQEIQNQASNMQPWMWYSVLSQLLSRVHNADMKTAFTEIIKKVLAAYPQAAGWQLMQLLKSSDDGHRSTGKTMLLEVGRKHEDVHRLVTIRLRLAEDLNNLATFNPPDGQNMNLVKSFPRLVGRDCSRLEKWSALIPLQSQMTAKIPRIDSSSQIKTANLRSFFPEELLSEKCLEHVDVFRTKEKPKKLTFIGSDGRHYPFLCKAERRGDLRKDSRMMEFSVMVNQLLAKNPDARRRNLEVRTFNVVILSEKCGLLEWVPNTKGMRHIIDDIWRGRKNACQQTVREVKELFDSSKDFYETFTRQVLPRHPPVLHKWFLQCGDPSVWLSKRLMFSQSQALWCMLGYLVGLGDRHGENILMDTESGRMVHVDFDCLFGKGMLLERPEMVPFRLTQNCVSAMGITGVEGVFRQCCELVMEVLRDRANTQTLLSVLHVFVADPLIEITAKRVAPSSPETMEDHRVQQARQTIGDVEKKLHGMLNVGAVVQQRSGDTGESVLSKDERARSLLGRDRGVGLSVKGQVDELLKAAMCKRNLSEMYIGWQPWL